MMKTEAQQTLLDELDKSVIENQVRALLDSYYRVDIFYTRANDYTKELPNCAS